MQKTLPDAITGSDSVRKLFKMTENDFVNALPKPEYALSMNQIDTIIYTDFPALHIYFKDGTKMTFRLEKIEEE